MATDVIESDSGTGDPQWAPVARLVGRRAAATPAALAAGDTGGDLTYGELDDQANRIARRLRDDGVRRETLVGLHFDRSRAMLAAFLGVLKAGATAQLLDPRWPAERTGAALRALPPRLILTAAGGRVPAAGIPVIEVEPVRGRARAPEVNVEVHPDNLAYVVHTSGSTGEPKMVGVTHRSVSHCVATHTEGHRITPGDRGSWLASPGSSAGVGEIWPYLAAGASVHTTEPDVAASPGELRDWLLRTGITKAFLNSPTAQQLVTLPWPDDCALRLVTVGGDRVLRWAPPELPFEVAVSYGSAEANGVASCLVPWPHRVTSRTATDRTGPPPVGRAWPDVRLILLDGEPGTASGELFVVSPELTRGYLGRPALTAERLLPAIDGGGQRMYRTGDLCSIDAGGLLHHRGRTGDVLKIRGQRVEPGDVEACLALHPSVVDAAVGGVTDPEGQTRLVAHVVVRDGLSETRLRRHLLNRLPNPLVPEAIVVLDRLPRNTNGKVDRAALPDPVFPPPATSDAVPQPPAVLPDDPVEARVLTLWCRHLNTSGARPEDDLMDHGGTSLTAGRLIAAVRDELAVSVRMRDFMRNPTLGTLTRLARSGSPRR